jgi:hypothetical protein
MGALGFDTRFCGRGSGLIAKGAGPVHADLAHELAFQASRPYMARFAFAPAGG